VIIPSQAVKIVVATKPVGFRKGHDGLAAVVQNELGLDPHSGIIVVFRAKRGDRIKVLLWDGSGLVMAYKRLERDKFAWPRISDGVMRLSMGQFSFVRGSGLVAYFGASGAPPGCGRVNRAVFLPCRLVHIPI
jgi:transposase